jgi:uroporphyrin-3 C-methyltransferase
MAATALALLALLITAGAWLDGRSELRSLREQLARQLHENEGVSREAGFVAKQSQEALRETQAKLSQLELKVAESQNQQVALEALYQELSRGRDESALAEIEQILTIAAQQLQLAGNVQAALLALQTADARLARGDSPQFIPLRKVLARDIERLKATPNIDLTGLALKLDQAIALMDSLPLAQDTRPQPSAADNAAKTDGSWTRLGAEILAELRQLVRVQNIEQPEAVLLAPSQAFFLRENVKLRLLNARLALLSRDEATYQHDLKTANEWLDRYFDKRSRATTAMRGTLSQLGANTISIAVPSIGESLAAVRNYKAAQDRTAR